MYTIKKVSEILDMSEHTIRFYSDQGIIPNLKRDKNNIRLFDEEALNWLTVIKYLRSTNMSLANIKDYIRLCLEGLDTIEARYNIMLNQQQIAKKQLEQAQNTLEFLNHKVSLYQQFMKLDGPDLTNPENWTKSNIEWLSKNYKSVTQDETSKVINCL